MIQLENLSPQQLDQLWPQGRGELLGFANHLERTGAGITADQIRLALQMAQKVAREQ